MMCIMHGVGAAMFRKRSGFTMIEVMVSMAIFAGCLASVLGGYNLLSRPYRGMYDGARELIADIENCAVNFDKIMTGDNGNSNKGAAAISPKKQWIKSLLVDQKGIQEVFDISFQSGKKGGYGGLWNLINFFKSMWSKGEDILVFKDSKKNLKTKGKEKSIMICQFNIDNHPVLNAAKKRYDANKVEMKNVYFYSFRDVP